MIYLIGFCILSALACALLVLVCQVGAEAERPHPPSVTDWEQNA